ncbi:MAG: BT0820 family HAD-type phosphatase [Bacteroidales bacterium]|nr:hydrolase [Bacteroidales bacterium]HQK36137.1 hypothetical protein [Bacteroidales bacterium]
MKIAVDFDGTIVENKFPGIGREKIFAFRTLRELQRQGHQIILWTFRTGKQLEEAVEFCRRHGLEFYAVNKSFPEEEFDETISRKIDADIFIDDRNLGGFPGWGEAWQIITGNDSSGKTEFRYESSSLWKKIFLWLNKR